MKKFKTALCSFLLVICFSANIFGDGASGAGNGSTNPPTDPPPNVVEIIGDVIEEAGENLLDYLYNLFNICPPRQCSTCPDDTPNCRPNS